MIWCINESNKISEQLTLSELRWSINNFHWKNVLHISMDCRSQNGNHSYLSIKLITSHNFGNSLFLCTRWHSKYSDDNFIGNDSTIKWMRQNNKEIEREGDRNRCTDSFYEMSSQINCRIMNLFHSFFVFRLDLFLSLVTLIVCGPFHYYWCWSHCFLAWRFFLLK